MILDTAGIRKLTVNAGMAFDQVDLGGLLKEFKGGDKSGSTLSFPEIMDVNLDIKLRELEYKDVTIRNLSSSIKASEKQLQLRHFYADLPFGSLDMDLKVSDYKKNDPHIAGKAKLVIDSLSIDQFLEMEALGLPGPDRPTRNDKKQAGKKNPAGLPENMDLDLDVKAGLLSYRNASISDLDLVINYSVEKIDLDHLNFSFAGGTVNVNGNVMKNATGTFPGYLYSKADSIDISDVFRSFGNFNQDKFTADNSTGGVSWASHYYFELGRDLTLSRAENLLILNTNIHDAEFDQVEPIEKTLFFVGHKSKEKMIISNLNINSFMYGDKMYFMDVLMNDNIANLDVFGEVDLGEKTMDMDLEISLSDLFFRTKAKRIAQTQEGEVNLEKDSKLFLNLSGPLSDHKLKLTNKRNFNRSRKDLMDQIKEAEKAFHVRQQGGISRK